MHSNITTIDDRHIGMWCQIVVTISHILGMSGNIIALYLLNCIDRKFQMRKIHFLLSYLATNDFAALLTSMVLMHLQLYQPELKKGLWFCELRVILRALGLCSGCVATVMAIERWLALVKPFVYKKYVTYKVVQRAILVLWATGAVVTCLPFVNFGLFYKQNEGCLRYRDAVLPKDIAYAYLFFAFGTLLCACIVWCNLGVIKELVKVGSRKHVLVRRISRSCSRTSDNEQIIGQPTSEELAFAKLMAVLCISFVICWMPQMISIPMAQLGSKSKASKLFFRIADILMAVHFTLDPYVYVLLRFRRNRNRQTCHFLLKKSTSNAKASTGLESN